MAQSNETWSYWPHEQRVLCFTPPFLSLDWLAGAERGRRCVALPISREIREGCCPLYHVSPIDWSNSLLLCVPDTVIPGNLERFVCWTPNKRRCRRVLTYPPPGKQARGASTGRLSSWHRGLVSLAAEKSPYVSGHQLVGHLQRRSHCIHH